MKYRAYIAAAVSVFLPVIVFAQQTGSQGKALNQVSNVNDVIAKAVAIGNALIYLLIAFGVLYIVYETVRYFMLADSEEARKEAGTGIFYGIVGIFIIVSIWGLVNILINTFPTGRNAAPDRLPNADFINGGASNATPAGGSGAFFDTPTNPNPGLYPS